MGSSGAGQARVGWSTGVVHPLGQAMAHEQEQHGRSVRCASVGTDLFVLDPDRPGPVVVLVHGAMDRGAGMAKVSRRLGDLAVIRYDRRGYGRSVPAGATDLDGHVEDLLGILDGRAGVVVGHSIGGLVGLAAAAVAPDEVRAAGAYEPPTPWAPWWPGTTPGSWAAAVDDPGEAAEGFLRHQIGDTRWERLPLTTRNARRAEGPALVAELRSAQAPPFDPAAVTVPVIVAHGSASIGRHKRAAAEVAATVPGARLSVIEGAGHGAPSSHPDDYAAFVRAVASAGGLTGPTEP